jgi:hypothetical protein
MNKTFYVYRKEEGQESRRLAFIEEAGVNEFAFNEYSPQTYTFMDICIKAPDLKTAVAIYDNPTRAPEGCEYLYSTEPQMTAAKRLVVSKQQERHKLNQQVSYVELQNIAVKTRKVISNIARRLYADSNKILKPQDIYQLLLKEYALTLVRLPYESKRRDGGEDNPPSIGNPV